MNVRYASAGRVRYALLAVIALVALLSSAGRARAADTVTQSRDLAAFDRIELNGAFTATIVAGTKGAFAMTGRPEDLARVIVSVDRGRLEIGMRSSSGNVRSIDLRIATPIVRSIVNQGAGNVHVSGLRGDVDLANRGTASFDVSGRASHLTIVNDGIGKIDAASLDARDATVTSDGIGSIDVRASGTLVMNVNGVGQIRYTGNPAHVESHVDGLGRIGRL